MEQNETNTNTENLSELNQTSQPVYTANKEFQKIYQGESGSTGLFGSMDKNRIIILSGILFELVLFIVFAFIGVWLYNTSSKTDILKVAGANLTKTKGMTSNFTIGLNGVSVDGTVSVDKDQNIKFNLNNQVFPIEAVYLKSKDSGYIKDIYSGLMMPSNIDTGSVTNKDVSTQYTEYTNVEKALEKYSQQNINVSKFDPKNSSFTVENLNYLIKQKDESFDGKSFYKFTYKPTKEFIQKIINDAQNSNKIPVQVTNADVKVDFWISKNDKKLYKINGKVSIEIASTDENIKTMMANNNKAELTWQQSFDYGYRDTIALAKNNSIVSSLDLSEQLDPAVTEKTKIRSDAYTVQAALESYYSRNGAYPDTLEPVKNSEYIYNYSEINFSNLDYTKTGNDYVISMQYNGTKFGELKLQPMSNYDSGSNL